MLNIVPNSSESIDNSLFSLIFFGVDASMNGSSLNNSIFHTVANLVYDSMLAFENYKHLDGENIITKNNGVNIPARL